MRLVELVDTSRAVSETRARSRKIECLAGCLSRMEANEIAIGVAFLSGELLQGKVGVGYAAVRDLGTGAVADEPALTLEIVNGVFDDIARMSGPGSSGRRTEALLALFRRATEAEQRFLKALLIGELRQGALEGILVDAVARAARVSPVSVRRAAMLTGDLGRVAQVARAEGAAGLARFRIEPLRPVSPMLAQAAEDVTDVLAGKDAVALEYKLDGARIQVHRSDDEVRVFTRALNDVTARLPEIVEAARLLPVRSAVLDGEALALDAAGRPHAFQTTMKRFGQRLDVEGRRGELPIRPFFFDCLHLDGEDLIDRPATERFDALSRITTPDLVIERAVVTTEDQARAFVEASLRAGHEGVIGKTLDAPYEAGRRGAAWLKLKPTHTLDLVVLAVEWGSGRRRGLLSNLHLGARDAASGQFVMLGKTFKGMTDAMLAWQTEKLLALEVSRDDHTVVVNPELVVEVAFDGVQESPQYPAGLALRFARVRAYREDKMAAQADTLDLVRAIFNRSRSG